MPFEDETREIPPHRKREGEIPAAPPWPASMTGVRRRPGMSDCRNTDSLWPSVEVMRRAKQIDDTGLIPGRGY